MLTEGRGSRGGVPTGASAGEATSKEVALMGLSVGAGLR